MNSKRWRDTHKEAVAAYAAGWYEAHKEAIAAQQAVYYADHKEEKAAYRVAHKAEKAAYNAKWRTNNPDKAQAQWARHRALKVGAESDGSVLSDVIAKFGRSCLRCGSEIGLSVDHVVPLILGGSDLIDNKQLLCVSCNSSKGIKTVDYRVREFA